jgi:hypothetical protein
MDRRLRFPLPGTPFRAEASIQQIKLNLNSALVRLDAGKHAVEEVLS